MKSILSLVVLPLAALMLAGCPGDNDKPVTPTQPPDIKIFTAVPGDILPGDSTLITYKVSGADSVILRPTGDKLTPVDSGQVYLKPAVPVVYSLLGYNKGGRDSAAVSITMTGAMPVIDNFTVTEDTILIDDSTTLNWSTTRTDSIVLVQGATRTQLALSGDRILKPTVDALYRAFAYNDIGIDTAQVNVRVENPVSVLATYGSYFYGEMGGGILSPELSFRVLDAASQSLRLPWMQFELPDGDGVLTADSGRPANGSFTQGYQFSGNSGHALLRAFVRDIDTVEVKLRANVLRFGDDAQGQYMVPGDTYGDALALNGTPASVDPDPTRYLMYANYEAALGLVLVIDDDNLSETAETDEEVFEIIVNTVFDKRTPENIGIGSTIQQVRAAYGDADSSWYDAAPPPARAFRYSSLGALFYTTVSTDSTVFEIHLWDPAKKSPLQVTSTAKRAFDPVASAATRYRRSTLR